MQNAKRGRFNLYGEQGSLPGSHRIRVTLAQQGNLNMQHGFHCLAARIAVTITVLLSLVMVAVLLLYCKPYL